MGGFQMVVTCCVVDLWMVTTDVWVICVQWLLVCGSFVGGSFCCVVGLWVVTTDVWLICGGGYWCVVNMSVVATGAVDL